MELDSESLYQQLGYLAADMPQLAGPACLTSDDYAWLGRAAALVVRVVGERSTDFIFLKHASDHLTGPLRDANAHQIASIVHRALALAEADAPTRVQVALIPVASPFDVLREVGKILASANGDVLIVDAYMGPNILTDFAPLTPKGVRVRLLTDGDGTKRETLEPVAARWRQQYGDTHPLEVRFTRPRRLHDRLIIVDGGQVTALTQSLKDFAVRSPGSILRVERELAEAKSLAYAEMWDEAEPLN